MINHAQVNQVIEQHRIESFSEDVAGCTGAGGAFAWAQANGFPHCRAANLTSSAGHWIFIVSEDGESWQILYQTNNYPKPGFSYTVDDAIMEGTAEAVLEMHEF